tara:strand:- start:6714 stop:7622 length:909 start_codon:yes stop_codon:yes gene_type:complete
MSSGWLFPGQGSQKVGMGHDLFLKTNIGKSHFKIANNILGYDIQNIIFEGPTEELKKTKNTQPAIYIISVILGKLLLAKGFKPNALAGHSLGEYSALTIGEAIDFEKGLDLVKTRSERMDQIGLHNEGSMAAIIGLSKNTVISLCNNYQGIGIVVPANINSDTQIVISGNNHALNVIMSLAKDKGAKLVTLLNVSGAFHSPLMEPARESLAVKLNSIEIKDSKYPVYANVNAKPIKNGTEIKKLLIRQIVSPVLWEKSIKNMVQNGINNFLEIGPGKILQGLSKRICSEIPITGIESLTDLE